ncbi:MAG: hypothetical protein R2778_03215 [Saprospiraceae bacterium]
MGAIFFVQFSLIEEKELANVSSRRPVELKVNACPVWERVPSCNSGLVEKNGKCAQDPMRRRASVHVGLGASTFLQQRFSGEKWQVRS